VSLRPEDAAVAAVGEMGDTAGALRIQHDATAIAGRREVTRRQAMEKLVSGLQDPQQRGTDGPCALGEEETSSSSAL